MRFKIIALAALLVSTQGCSVSDGKDGLYTVGDVPDLFSTGYMWGHDDNIVAAIDLEGRTIQRFSLEPFRHVHSLELPLKHSSQGLIASPVGSYYVTIGTNGKETVVAITKANGSSIKDPILLTGTMRGVAYDPLEHLLVLTDDLGTLAFLRLAKDGSILESCKAGSSFSAEGGVVSGAMLSGGTLALALGKSTLAFVDVKTTLANRCQSVSHRSVTVADATDMRFIAASPNDDDHVVIQDSARFILVKEADGTIAASFDLEGRYVLKASRRQAPHLILESYLIGNDRHYDLVYLGADNTFKTSSFRTEERAIRQSVLDAETGILTVELDPKAKEYDLEKAKYVHYGPRDIYRFRISDQLVLDRTVIDDSVHAVLTKDYVVSLYPSPLGYTVRSGYGAGAKKTIVEGYNLDIFRKRFKED